MTDEKKTVRAVFDPDKYFLAQARRRAEKENRRFEEELRRHSARIKSSKISGLESHLKNHYPDEILKIEDFNKRGSEKKKKAMWSPARKNNWARLHQTPNIWGLEMSRQGVMAATEASVQKLADAMQSVIESASEVVYITSLDPPRGQRGKQNVFYKAIRDGIRNANEVRKSLAKALNAAREDASGNSTLNDAVNESMKPLEVKILFGFPPDTDSDRIHPFKEFLAYIEGELGVLEHVRVIVGHYTDGGTTFNHSKIFASDTGHSVVGGHNFYDSDYACYPPVHDVSVEVKGAAAIDALNFAIRLWTRGEKIRTNDDSKYSYEKEIKHFGSGKILWNGITSSTWVQAVELVTKNNNTAEWESVTQERLTQLNFNYQDPSKVSNFGLPNGGNWHRATIMTVGRLGGWTYNADSKNASDRMKTWLFENAKHSIKIAHQDLIAMGIGEEKNKTYGILTKIGHGSCRNLAKAMKRNKELDVFVVVTGEGGSGQMDGYSNYKNAIGMALSYIINYYAGSWIGRYTSAKRRAKQAALDRLHVAPIHFTDNFTSSSQNGRFWPRSEHVDKMHGGTAKKEPKAVGQHMKTMLIDNTTMVVGSDNLYPHPLAEINYVIEGPFVDEFKTTFWDNLWRYSSPYELPIEGWRELISDEDAKFVKKQL